MAELTPTMKEHLSEPVAEKLEEMSREEIDEALTVMRAAVVASNLAELNEEERELAINLVEMENQ